MPNCSACVAYINPTFQKFVPNKNCYVGMAVIWLTVLTLLPKLLNVAMLTDRHNVGTVSQTTTIVAYPQNLLWGALVTCSWLPTYSQSRRDTWVQLLLLLMQCVCSQLTCVECAHVTKDTPQSLMLSYTSSTVSAFWCWVKKLSLSVIGSIVPLLCRVIRISAVKSSELATSIS